MSKKIPGLSKGQQSKAWCFTINNYTSEDEEWVNRLECEIIFASIEKGESGTPHIQGYVKFRTNHRLAAVKKLHGKAHWEIAKGNVDHNKNYIMKSGSTILRESNQTTLATLARSDSVLFGAKARAHIWDDTRLAAQEGRMEDIPSDMFIRYYNALNRIRDDYGAKPDILDEINNFWFYGPTGTGKSKTARERWPDSYIKNLNKWWCGYRGEETVIIEEYHPDCKLNSFLKIWADRYPFRGEYKGGSHLIRPKQIIVCSNFSLEECFSGVDLEAVKRRFNVVLFN